MDALLNQLTALVQDLRLPEEAEYLRRLQEIRERLHHPQLRLAVIGNFSCGKSTFLNAMLKRPLLSMANMPTTAIPTFIDWCAPGESPEITLEDTNDQPHLLDDGGKAWFREQTGTPLPDGEGDLLDFLTTTNTLHDFLSSVHISFPVTDGYPGYCLIDTPGINPGDEEAAGHILHTQDILRDEADAAIVLFPSYCAYTRDFSDFLDQNARHLLANSIFVVTKIDIVPTEGEREQLVRFVRSNLEKKLDLEDPQVYCCSAGCALDHYTGISAEAHWARDFETMMDEIFASLEPRRLRMASSRTYAMIMELTHALRSEMDRKQQELQRLLDNLEKYSFAQLQNQYLSMFKTYSDKAKQAAASISRQSKDKVSTAVDLAVDKLCKGINLCSSKWAINSYVKREGKTVTDQTTAQLRQILEQSCEMIQTDQHRLYTEFSCDVEQLLYEYDFLMGSLRGIANRLEKGSPGEEISLDLNLQLNSAQNEIWGSLSLFTGGIVAVSGAWVVMLAGLILSGFMGLPATKERAVREIKEKLYGLKKDTYQQCGRTADRLVEIHKEAAEKLMLEYQKTYKELFERKKAELEQYRRKLEAELEHNSRSIRQLEEIMNTIQRTMS